MLTSLPAGTLPAFCKASGLFAAVSEVLDEHPISSNCLHLCWEHPCLSPVGTRIKQELTGK